MMAAISFFTLLASAALMRDNLLAAVFCGSLAGISGYFALHLAGKDLGT